MPKRYNQPPDRWLDYSKMGNVIEGSRFLAVKVPLKESCTKTISEEQKFSPENLLHLTRDQQIKIGLIIDLTFTTRYYDPNDFKKCEIAHRKILVPGHIIPPRHIYEEFTKLVKAFETNNKHNDDVIVVHCTHGLNRTGYMICKYLIQEKNIKPKKAIAMFNTARGHEIERENYLNDLMSTKYNGTISNGRANQSKTTTKVVQKKPRHARGTGAHCGAGMTSQSPSNHWNYLQNNCHYRQHSYDNAQYKEPNMYGYQSYGYDQRSYGWHQPGYQRNHPPHRQYAPYHYDGYQSNRHQHHRDNGEYQYNYQSTEGFSYNSKQRNRQ